MWTAIAGFFTAIVQGWTETRKAKQERKIAEINADKELAMSKAEQEHKWEMKALEKSSMIARWFFNIFYTVPVIYTCINPEEGRKIWEALEVVPEWVIGVIVTMTGFAYGSAPAKKAGAFLIEKWAYRERTQKLEIKKELIAKEQNHD